MLTQSSATPKHWLIDDEEVTTPESSEEPEEDWSNDNAPPDGNDQDNVNVDDDALAQSGAPATSSEQEETKDGIICIYLKINKILNISHLQKC